MHVAVNRQIARRAVLCGSPGQFNAFRLQVDVLGANLVDFALTRASVIADDQGDSAVGRKGIAKRPVLIVLD